MKRNILLSAVMLFVAIAMQAAPITSRQAANKAKAFLNGGSNKKFASANIKMAAPDSGIQPYYVFNIGENNGFVIVSGDDAAYPVLGYSRKGHFDINNIPDNMKGWLDGYASDIKKLQKMNLPEYKAPETRAEEWPAIPYLVKSEWNQTYPYNRQCPKYPGDMQRRPTGCVATAMAQVMYYHKWPVAETSAISGYTFRDEPAWGGDGTNKTEAALEPTTFEWDLMTDIYDYYSEEESEQAVAKLMKYVGHSVEMMYGVEASGAYSENIAGALVNCFGYKNTARIIYRDNYETQQEWDAVMYSELVENRPILYSGSTKDGAGHQFVCDGYENGFFHINWGWGGMSDGFFKLEVLDPYDQGTGGAGTGMAFSEYQSAVIGVQKPVENDGLHVDDVKSEIGAEKQIGIVLNNSRKNYTSMQFDLTLPEGVSISNDGTGMPKVYIEKSRTEKGDHKVSVNKISNGSFRFVMYSPTNSCIVGKEGAVINVTLKISAGMSAGEYTAKISNVLMCNTKLEGFDINGCEFKINLNGTPLLLGDADDNGVVDDNDVTSIINNIVYVGSDPFNFKLADVDADGMLDVADAVLTSDIILKNAGADRNIVATEIDYNDAVSFSPNNNDLLLSIKNNTIYKAMQLDVTLPADVAFTEDISLTSRTTGFEYACKDIATGKYRIVIYSRDGSNIEGNDGAVLKLTTDNLAVEAKISNIVMFTSDLRKVLLKDVDYKMPTGIENVNAADNENCNVYTLEGVRVSGNINNLEKGIYIVNGKKMVIK